jgi:hypothetical protein
VVFIVSGMITWYGVDGGGGYVYEYVLIRISKMRLFVIVCVSFNCVDFLVRV